MFTVFIVTLLHKIETTGVPNPRVGIARKFEEGIG